jgi:hypothetical protein
MSKQKFAPRDIPFQASSSIREYLEDQMRRLQPLVNGAAQVADDEVIPGSWEFSGTLIIHQSGNAFTDSTIIVSGDAASILFDETDQTGGNERYWTWGVGTRAFRLRTFTDALGVGQDAFAAIRADNSTTIEEVELNGTSLDFNGNADISGTLDLHGLLTTHATDILLDDTNDLRISASGNSQLSLTSGTANANLDLNAIDDGTGTCSIRIGRATNTSGINRCLVLRGNSSTALAISMEGRGSSAAGGALFIAEGSAAHSSRAGQGHLWVKNTTPCELWFTDDAGTDTQIV